MNRFSYLIIEDEDPAAARMERMISAAEPESKCLARLVSINSSVNWLRDNPSPDIIFMDIQLADGNSFEIFNQVKINCPVIFTTAFDNYAIDAFKVNSIDYLLKPVKPEQLTAAIEKYLDRSRSQSTPAFDVNKLIQTIGQQRSFQKRILIRYGDIIKAIEIDDAAYFYTEQKVNYLCTFDGRSYPIDHNLDQVESFVDPAVFFRINRQLIVNIRAIKKMVAYSKSRVKLELDPVPPFETIVSTERSPNFKSWLTGTTMP